MPPFHPTLSSTAPGPVRNRTGTHQRRRDHRRSPKHRFRRTVLAKAILGSENVVSAALLSMQLPRGSLLRQAMIHWIWIVLLYVVMPTLGMGDSHWPSKCESIPSSKSPTCSPYSFASIIKTCLAPTVTAVVSTLPSRRAGNSRSLFPSESQSIKSSASMS